MEKHINQDLFNRVEQLKAARTIDKNVEIATATGFSEAVVSNYLKGRVAVSDKFMQAFNKAYLDYENNVSINDNEVNESPTVYDKPPLEQKKITKPTTKVSGVPYYDVDFTSSVIDVFNNQQVQPDYFIYHPFFDGCDLVVRNSGKSMSQIIKHGDAIGLRIIHNWQDFILLGEVYAIVTESFRMIKIISKGDTKDSYTLVSKPSPDIAHEFPNQQINKNQILAVCKVQASSHLF